MKKIYDGSPELQDAFESEGIDFPSKGNENLWLSEMNEDQGRAVVAAFNKLTG